MEIGRIDIGAFGDGGDLKETTVPGGRVTLFNNDAKVGDLIFYMYKKTMEVTLGTESPVTGKWEHACNIKAGGCCALVVPAVL
jgi:hypothetical protein